MNLMHSGRLATMSTHHFPWNMVNQTNLNYPQENINYFPQGTLLGGLSFPQEYFVLHKEPECHNCIPYTSNPQVMFTAGFSHGPARLQAGCTHWPVGSLRTPFT